MSIELDSTGLILPVTGLPWRSRRSEVTW
ncbi:hypothetical protein RSAG8_12259, partial [Rhizoctonia solani AG-8 WAC10335]